MDNYLLNYNESLKVAKAFVESHNYGKAFAHLLLCLCIDPENKSELEEFLTSVTIRFAGQLYNEGRNEDLISTFTSAIEEFPFNVILLNSFGSFLVRIGNIEKAYKLVTRAISLDSNSLLCDRNLQQIKDMLVPRWHFRMLNDHKRNMSYRNAILNQISLGYNDVLDIGTGTGLLSLFASEGNANSIQACDYSQTMVAIASKVFETNKSCNIKLQNVNSLDIDLNDFKKVSLIVTEILDSGIFGENIITSVLHAAKNLTLPVWNIVPCGITVHIAAIESKFIYHKSRLKNYHLCGLLKTKLLAHSDDNQYYDTENLKYVKNVNYLTHTQVLYELNLKNQNLKSTLSTEKVTVLKCSMTGYVDAFAVWMTIKLDDNNFITSSPQLNLDDFCCWDQAIFATKQPFFVQKDAEIIIKSFCIDNVILNLTHDCLSPTINSFPLPTAVLEFLNDENYLKMLDEILEIIKRKESLLPAMLDLSPFPVLGLILLKEGITVTLACKNSEDNVESFIKLLAELNGIDLSKISFCNLNNMANYGKFDIIVFDWIQDTGELSDDLQTQTEILKMLKDNGLRIPKKIEINGLLVESKWLDFITKVSDANLNNYKIAEFINEYQIRKHIDFHIDSLQYIPCSKVINFGTVNMNGSYETDTVNVSITENCSVNGVLFWYNIIFDDTISYSTNNDHGYIKNAAFVFDSRKCNKFDNVLLNIIQMDGILKIDIKN